MIDQYERLIQALASGHIDRDSVFSDLVVVEMDTAPLHVGGHPLTDDRVEGLVHGKVIAAPAQAAIKPGCRVVFGKDIGNECFIDAKPIRIIHIGHLIAVA